MTENNGNDGALLFKWKLFAFKIKASLENCCYDQGLTLWECTQLTTTVRFKVY